MSKLTKIVKWATGRDTGLSSCAILSHMVTGECDGSYPYDPADLGRCLRLLDLFPEWEGRIGEMGVYGPVWRRYAKSWAQMRKSMEDEVGVDWSKAKAAPATYELMKKIEKRRRP
jgi:hypothetical protein